MFPIFGTLQVTGLDTDDEFLIRTMPDNPDFIEVFVNGQREYAGLREALIGGIQVDGVAGNDTLVVDWTVGDGDPVPPGGIFFQGGIPEGGGDVGDTLDLLTGDLQIDFQNEQSDLDGGLFVVGDSPAVSFDNVERTQVGTTDYLRPDLLEVNDSLMTATVLGSEPAVTLRDLTIHDIGEAASNPDFFRITASQTGYLIVNTLFDDAQGDLTLVVHDGRGNVVSTSATTTDNEQVVIPVVAQETYVIQVNGGADGAINTYALEVENFAAPVPQAIVLDPLTDSGMMNNDGITADTTPRFTIQADLTPLTSQGIAILNADQAAAGDTPGAAVFVTIRDQISGTIESGFATPLGDDLFSFGSDELPDGFLVVSASVQVFDPRLAVDPADPTNTVSDSVIGSTLQSEPITILLDTVAPIVTSPQLLPSSDSGMSLSDQVTNIMQPAFAGTSGPNEKIRIFANGFLVGEGQAGTDGRWEITIEPLAEGIYDITNDATDLAGNFGESGIVNRIEIDKTAPNQPFLDLTSGSDTGLSSTDNVTGDNTLTFNMTTSDLPLDHLIGANLKFRLYLRPEDGSEVLIYNSAEDDSIPAENLDGGFTDLTLLTRELGELPDGTHNFKLEVEDRAGNISTDFLLDVTIDTTLPSPLTLDLIAESDTGMDNADDVTSFTRPTFSGSGDVGGAVSLFANGQLVGSGVVGGDLSDGIEGNGLGAWEITSGSLTDGIHEITAVIENDNGSVSSEPLTIEVDTLQPNTPLLDLIPSSDTGHTTNDNITNVINPTFNMASVDPNQDAHISEFNYKFRLFARLDSGPEELLYDSSLDDTFPNSAFDGTFTNLENLRRTIDRGFPDGTHNFKLEVEDRAGNISEDFLLNVEVDTQLVTADGGVTLELLNSSDTGMDNRDGTTKINQPAFSGVAEVGAEVSLFAGGVLVGTTTVGSDETDFASGNGLGAWEITSEPLDDGQHELLVHVEDWAGNFERSEPITIDVDTTPPNTPFLDLVGGSSLGLNVELTTSNSLTFNMTTEDPDADSRANEFNLKYRIFLRPEGGEEVLVYESLADPNIPEGNLLGGFTDLNFLQTVIGELPDGEHNFKLEVEDRAGNISDDFLLTVRIENTPVEALTIDLISSSDAGMSDVDNVTNIDQPAFNGVGTIGTEVRLVNDQGEIIGTATVGGDASNGVLGDGLGRWEITSEPLADGVYTAFAELEDNFGNVDTTETITFEIDTLQPNTPFLDLIPTSDTGLSDQDNVTSTLLPTFHMATEDPNQDDHLSQFNFKFRLFLRLDSGVERLVYDSVADDTFPASAVEDGFISLENLRREIDLGVPDGVHNFKLEVEDRAGNISEDFLLNVTIDTVLDTPDGAVGIDLASGSDSGMSEFDNVTRIDTPTFSGVAEVGAQVAIIANGILIGTATVGSDETDFVPGDGLGAWEVTVGPLDDGTYEVIAHVEDLAGNFLQSDSLSVEVDTTQPNTPFLDLLNDTGHSDHDDITGESSLTFNLTTQDPIPFGGRASDFNLKYRIFLRPEGGEETLIFDSVTDTNIDPSEILEGFTNLNQLQATLGPFPDGVHNFKLEVEDRAGNISEDFLLNVQIDSMLEGDPGVDLIASSDSGMFDDDNVTGINEPAFTGVAEVGSTVRLRANGVLVGIAEVQSDDSDGVPGDGLGEWEITSEPLDDDVYEITAEVEDWAGNIETSGSITIEVDTLQPNTPFLDIIPESDSGLNVDDDETFEVIPIVNMATIDPNQDAHISQFNYKYRLFVRLDSGIETLVYDSVTDGDSFTASSFQDGFTSLENLRRAIDLGLPDGTHNFKLEVEDRAGNISEDFLLDVTIDTVLDTPDGVITIDLVSSSDSGMSERDNVTNISSPTLGGIAEVGATVTIFADGQVVGTGIVGSDETDFVPGNGLGAWQVTTEVLDDGRHELLAHVEDLAGNFLRSDSLTIEVDTLQPNTPFLDLLNDTGHSDDDNITLTDTLDFNFTTEDPLPAGDRLFDTNLKYRIFLRPEGGTETLVFNSVIDTNIDPANILEGFTDLEQLQATLGPFPDGVHNFKLEVEDRAGNISEDFLLTVEIDTELAGDPDIDLIASSDSGMFDDDNVTNIDEPAFTGVAEVGSTVRLRANGVLIGEAVVHSDASDGVPGDGLGEWEITSEPLDDGIYDITAEVEDWAGNIETTGALMIEVDTLQSNTPFLDLLPTSDSGLRDDDEVTNDIIPTFNMATIDPNQDDHISEFNYKYRLFVRLDSGVERLVYDSSTDGDSFTASSFQDGFTSLENLRREVDLGVPDGVHNFKLEVEDRAGNITEDFLLDVTFDTVLEAPNETITLDLLTTSDTGMSETDNVTNKDQPAFTGVAEIDSVVTLFADGQIVGVGRVGSDETDGVPGDGFGAWEITVEPLADGIHNITAHVEDLAGNFLQSDAMQIEIDTRAPNTPFLDLASTSDSGIGGRDEVTSDNTPTFNMTTTDESPDGHLFDENLKFRLYVRPEGGTEVLVFDSAEDFTIPPEAIRDGLTDLEFLSRSLQDQLPDGTHNFKLEVEDRAGNISEDFLLNVTIDTTLVAPTIDLATSSDSGMSDLDNVTNINAPTFSGTGDVGNQVTLFANGVIVGTGFVGSDLTDFVPGNGRGAWEITIDPLDDGIYDVLAHIEDAAGNFERSDPMQIEIDTLVPNTPHLDLVTASDTGHGIQDNITNDTTPTFTFTTEDPNQEDHLSQFNYKYRLFLRPEGGIETLVFNSVGDPLIPASAVDGAFTSLELLERTLAELPDGIHNFKLEVEDRAGNISQDVVLNVEIDSTVPDVGQIDLINASDSGMSSVDNVTNIDQPAFAGLGTANTQVRLFANGQFVGTAEVGSDESDGFVGNGLGIWEITSEPLKDDVYTMTATFEDWAGNISASGALQIEVDTLAPNTPFLDLLEPFDTGRNDDDNITNVPTLNFSATTEDPNTDIHEVLFPGGENLKFRIFVRPESGQEMLVYDSVTDPNITDRLDGLTSLQQILAAVDGLPDGLHNFKLEVEDRAGNISEDFLQNVLIDRQAFEGTCSLHPDSDTGIWGIDSTFSDGITTDNTPTFVGTAEANSVITLFVDGVAAGTTVATPFDGDNAFQNGTFEITSSITLQGGEVITFSFEDAAGNSVISDCGGGITIQVDGAGPRIENVTRDDAVLTSVFDPKPAGGPDPLIDSIIVHFSDGPNRPAGITYDAVLQQLALEEGNYRLVGDANGNIPITSVEIVGTNPGPGPATTAVRLNFGLDLPDDRYTFTVFDRISDAAGNPLDGESGANGPFLGNAGLTSTVPIFPTGDGSHGGDFLARFTIDSRPEIAVWSAGSVFVDTNGNFTFDQDNQDFVNRDIVYTVGFTTDDIFAGNFAGPNGVTDGYDKLAAYGHFGPWQGGTFRWLIDLDNDGVVDIDVEDPAGVNGLPFAGNFDGNDINGDEVGLFTGKVWHFDTDGDFMVDTALQTELIGYPVIGDFDNDGFDDLATWTDDTFMVDLANGVVNGWDGVADETFRFGFIGVRERPIVADMDQDGFDDFGLWVPDRGGITPRESGEWYWLVSGGNSVLDRIVPSTDPVLGNTQEVQFRPIPFGNDIFAQFGDEFAIPIVGNFDPPTLPGTSDDTVSQLHTNPIDPMDVNNDGHVTPRDVLITINYLNQHGATSVDDAEDIPFLDTNNDDFISSLDALRIINYLNEEASAVTGAAGEPEAEEPEAVDAIADDVAFAVFASRSTDFGPDEDEEDA